MRPRLQNPMCCSATGASLAHKAGSGQPDKTPDSGPVRLLDLDSQKTSIDSQFPTHNESWLPPATRPEYTGLCYRAVLPGCAVVLRPFQGRDSTRHIALEPSPNEPVDASDCQEMRCVLYAHATVLSDLPRQTLASCASVHSAYLDNASGHDMIAMRPQYKLKGQCRRR